MALDSTTFKIIFCRNYLEQFIVIFECTNITSSQIFNVDILELSFDFRCNFQSRLKIIELWACTVDANFELVQTWWKNWSPLCVVECQVHQSHLTLWKWNEIMNQESGLRLPSRDTCGRGQAQKVERLNQVNYQFHHFVKCRTIHCWTPLYRLNWNDRPKNQSTPVAQYNFHLQKF